MLDLTAHIGPTNRIKTNSSYKRGRVEANLCSFLFFLASVKGSNQDEWILSGQQGEKQGSVGYDGIVWCIII
jgi:hypothetical protein